MDALSTNEKPLNDAMTNHRCRGCSLPPSPSETSAVRPFPGSYTTRRASPTTASSSRSSSPSRSSSMSSATCFLTQSRSMRLSPTPRLLASPALTEGTRCSRSSRLMSSGRMSLYTCTVLYNRFCQVEAKRGAPEAGQVEAILDIQLRV